VEPYYVDPPNPAKEEAADLPCCIPLDAASLIGAGMLPDRTAEIALASF